MCNPVALGVASFGSSALGAIGQHQQAQAQAAAQNKAIAAKANQRNRQFELDTLQGVAAYSTAKIDAEIQQDEAGLAARRAMTTEQLKEQDADDEFRLALSEMSARRQLAQRSNEGGRARSANKNQLLAMGRAEGALRANRKRQSIASFRRDREAVRQANKQRQKLYASVANPYRPGPAPSQDVQFVQGPSTLGLVAGIGQAAIGGVQTYNSLKP